MAQCLTDGAVYEITVGATSKTGKFPAIVHAVMRIPRNVIVKREEEDEIRERVHRGLEWALAPWFVGKFQNDQTS